MHHPDFAAEGYARSVPYGPTSLPAPEGTAPTFMIRALRDPDGANLDRIQILKGWVEGGEPMTKVFDVAWSGDREPDANDKVPPWEALFRAPSTPIPLVTLCLSASGWNPNSSPRSAPTTTCACWRSRRPSWLAYDQAFYGNIDLPADAVLVQQERAYTSPFWFTPSE